MKIELKKLKISLALSEETTAFTADVYINGKLVGYAKNGGYGGSTDIMPYEKENGKILAEADAYCKTLPPYKGTFGDLPMDLEMFIDDIVYKELEKQEKNKFQKQLLRAQLNSLLFGVPNSDKVTTLKFKNKMTIEKIVSTPQGRFQLANIIQTELKKLKEDETILNTNIDFSLPEFSAVRNVLAKKSKAA